MFKLWKNMDDDDKSRLVKTTGLLVALFAVFTLLATVSYFFTWKVDQSILAAPVRDASVEVRNIAGKLGYKWANLLVRKWFGLGSLALVIILFAVSVRLLLRRWHYSMVKTILLTVSGALVASFLLAFISDRAGLGNAFGGGLGGECGEAVVEWSCNLFGKILTGLILLALLAMWLFFASKKFNRWMSGIGAAETADEPDSARADGGSDKVKPLLDRKADGKVLAGEDNAARGTSSVAERSEPSERPIPPRPQPTPVAAPVVSPLTAPKDATAVDKPLEVIKDDSLTTEVKKELPRINVRDELPNYKFPSLSLLEEYSSGHHEVTDEELARNNNKIRATLENYRIQINDVKAIVGPTVTLYKVYPAPGVKIAEIKKLQEDIGMYLHARGVRVVTLTDSVGIEVANDKPSIVPMRAVLNDEAFRGSKAELPIAIGYTIQQKVKVFDLADAPHLLVAGATKQGKSVGLNAMVASLLYSKHPSELKFVFIDPKMVEFSAYGRLLHHYLAVLPCNDEREEKDNAIVKKPDKAEKVLKSLVAEMEQRYELLSKALVPNIKLYNEKYKDRHLLPTEGHRFLPYIVTVVDEYADLTMSVGGGGDSKAMARSISTSIIRLAQKGRAAGIHIVLATQRPSVDVITGLIKANFPTRIAFRVISRIDSSTILDSPGAEKLIGRGDMLYYAGVEMERIQCALIDSDEISELTKFIGDQQGYKKSYNTPYYLPDVEEATEDGSGGMVDMKNLDERFEEAAKMIVMNQRGSTSDLQRRLGMGYAKAGRVMDQLEAAGVVGPQEGAKPRQVLISSLEELEKVLEAFRNQ
ncbi:MAG: DNA translocase FtsK 4TM domain-containing protein [Bacteroidales bacterium]|nr:DNA translocase FtsK 4TM domain-containing protein [Bacteroidales bacterium]